MWARWLGGLVAGVVAGLLYAGTAGADPVADFYRGKQVSVIVPSPPGGGYDLYARFLARYMGKHIPGNPTLIVKNMPAPAASSPPTTSPMSRLPTG
jgi:tripartite-type tricarboxylate transporter receptor subunit TctC